MADNETANEAYYVCLKPEYRNDFPCNANAIQAVSMGIATAGVCLLFVRFFLLREVSSSTQKTQSCEIKSSFLKSSS